MKYNSNKQYRRSIRLKSYDYSSPGAYFITICTHNMECYFQQYPQLKEIIEKQWKNIPKRFPNVKSDEFIIMPNHIHGIIFIMESIPQGGTVAQSNKKTKGATNPDVQVQNKNISCMPPINRAGARPAPTSLGEIIGTFKSLCVNEWLIYIKDNKLTAPGKFWQRNYYEHIIRNDEELLKTREYIINNPSNWEQDENNPINLK